MQLGQCPVCKIMRFIQDSDSDRQGNIVVVLKPQPMYQRSYDDMPGYISSRCIDCYDKAERKRSHKPTNGGVA